ncbi:RagB/SusD family nutrient uptake outer membrane protein [Mucilaginibacter sp. OK098]|uniref:RagB/SusD family nutrient uptake outer membrane protein n=1 Tax=Mucilaginibacter sp. OK098 TaxID=1855297 RepID=UPI00091FD65D|nr:RagB/SusD family nutrient uptake outer membrane protein [Mucilaginibacter sp. OK098]SHM58763.1 Starch-binding associating with outer membrane [Mucilaginibacter sp. OK098]
MKLFNYKIATGIKWTTFVCLLTLIFSTGCRKYLDIPLPVDKVAGASAFVNDNSTSTVVNGNFSNLVNGVLTGSPVMGENSVGYRTGLYADELQSISASDILGKAYFGDALTSLIGNGTQWSGFYKQIYNCNLTIEGINSAKNLKFKNQWLGETLFTRAFIYFNLVNLYGDVPLALTSDFNKTQTLARAPKSDVYQQIVADLKQAQGLLTNDYSDGLGAVTDSRGRPNLQAVNALLARVYLYNNDYVNAAKESTKVIVDSRYQLVAPSKAFLAASSEAIWYLVPPTGSWVAEFSLYNGNMPASLASPALILTYGIKSAMMPNLVNAFEPGDTRFTNWVRPTTVAATGTTPATVYYFPNKYKSNTPGTENVVVLRLAEQYLIRAEALVQQGDLNGAKADINTVRTRAGLGGVTATTKDAMLAAIAKERETELFTEFGHRFFDLKRTGTLDAAITAVSALKGSTWNPQRAVWPIPLTDITNDPSLTQNPGYN